MTSPASKTFYLTTAIDYANASPHIGHVYEKIVADVIVRYHRLFGFDVRFSIGTDEHGEKIYKAAKAQNLEPQAFVDAIVPGGFQALYQRLGISADRFIRTTEAGHKQFVQDVLQKVYNNGDIYLAEYEGLYSVGSERFVTEKELVESPDGQKRFPGDKDPPELRREQNYFFRMEKHRPWLLNLLEAQPELVQPVGYRNELLEMLREPIGDLSISRPVERLPWGIPIPWDEGHVTYVWFDALINYLSQLHTDAGDLGHYWPTAWHVIGKDILKPHGVFWPTMLHAAGFEPYGRLCVHGHITASDGQKIGKSLGNAINPLALLETYGVDALRYALARDTTYGPDSPFGEEALVARLNADLANDLGNLLSRVASMVDKYLGGVVPQVGAPNERESGIAAAWQTLPERVLGEVRNLRLHLAIESILEAVRDLNRFVAESQPWALHKRGDADAQERLKSVLYTLLEGLRWASLLLEPVIPEKALEIRNALGLAATSATGIGAKRTHENALVWGALPPGTRLQAQGVLFPKIETPSRQENPMSEAIPEETLIEIDDFAKVDLRVAEVLEAARVPKADKLLQLTLRVGDETRTVLSGIAQSYTPEELVGKHVVVVANLKPRAMRGITSQGMILASEDETGRVVIVSPERIVPSGKQVR